MIVANLEEIGQVIPAGPCEHNLQVAFDYLRTVRDTDLPDGRIEIDGDRVFALVQSYCSVLPGETVALEAHRKYIDVQYIAQGEEAMGWTTTDRLTEDVPFDEAKDIWFGNLPAGDTTFLRLKAGQLAVFFPTDGHTPRLAYLEPLPVKKYLVKVAVQG